MGFAGGGLGTRGGDVMIIRQRLPMAVRVNVVPSRRRRAGLGDTCTPTNCPSGPYSDSVSNYDYWLQQGMQSGVVPTPAQGTNPSVDTASVSAAMNTSWASYSDLQTAVGWELCPGPDVAAQFACSQRNTKRAQQISDIQQQYGGRVPSSILASIVPVVQTGSSSIANPSIVVAGPITPVPGHGSLSFVTSRGGNVLYPGDTWTISISGATPNAPIAVVGGKNGAMNTTPTGTTDNWGNFSLSGTIDSSAIGSWYEGWTVNGIGISSFSFTVQAAPATSVTTPVSTTPVSTTPISTTTGSTTTPATTTATTANWFTNEMIAGVPNWALVAAACAISLFAFSSGGKR